MGSSVQAGDEKSAMVSSCLVGMIKPALHTRFKFHAVVIIR